MGSRSFISLNMAAVMFTFVCLLSFTVTAEVLKIGGTGGDLGSMKLLGTAFEKTHPDVKVQVLPSLGSGGGVRAVLTGVIDLGLSSRPLKKKEKEAGALSTAYAKTSLVFAVSESSPVNAVTTSEVVDIYAGRRTAFNDGTPIRISLRPKNDTDTAMLLKYIKGMTEADAIARQRIGVPTAYNDQKMVDFLEQTPGAFGPTSMSIIRGEQRQLKALSLDGVMPSSTSLINGEYPLVKTYFFVTTSSTSKLVKSFMDFIYTPAATALLEDLGHQILVNK